MVDKNSDAIVIHLPKDQRLQFERLAEQLDMSKSELGRMLVDAYLSHQKKKFEHMKSIFETE